MKPYAHLAMLASALFAASSGLPAVAASNPSTWAAPPSISLSAPYPVLNYYSPKMYGAKCDGTTDDHVALQAMFTAAPMGATVYFPSKCSSSTSLSIPNAITLEGSGFSFNAAIGYGSSAPAWAQAKGGGIVFTNSSSCGILYHNTAAGFQAPIVENFFLIGPGAGTCTGFSLGQLGDAGTYGIDQAFFSNVLIGNFPVGMAWYSVEQGYFSGVRLRGNSTCLLVGENNASANVYEGGDIIACAVYGVYDHAGAVGNIFDGVNFEVNGTASVSLSAALDYVFINDYWEDNSGVGIDIDITNSQGTKILNAANIKRGINLNDSAQDTVMNNVAFLGSPVITVATTVSTGNLLQLYTGSLTITDTLHKLQWQGATVLVAGLPTCNSAELGVHLTVSDAAAVPVYHAASTGGGSIVLPVFCDGTSWKNE